jgi:hypothetical protein
MFIDFLQIILRQTLIIGQLVKTLTNYLVKFCFPVGSKALKYISKDSYRSKMEGTYKTKIPSSTKFKCWSTIFVSM